MTQEAWLTILAILLAPLVALQVSVWLAKGRDAKTRRVKIYRTLMATRAYPVSRDHVLALNSIDTEFYGKKFKKVRTAWKALVSQFGAPDEEVVTDSWGQRTLDLRVELLFLMGESLGFDIDKDHIRRAGYSPKAHGQLEDEQALIRKLALAFFEGKVPLPVKVVDSLGDPK